MSSPNPTRLLPKAQRQHRNQRPHFRGNLKFDDMAQDRDFTRGIGNAHKSSRHTTSDRLPLRVLGLAAVMALLTFREASCLQVKDPVGEQR